MMNETKTLEQIELLPDLIPLALIAVETGNPVDWVANRFGDSVVLDDLGMRAVSATEARTFFVDRAEEKARWVEERRRRTEEAAKRKRVAPVGAPARDGLSPVEAMVSQDPAFSTPAQDFGPGYGSPTSELLDAELAAGQRELARRRAETAEKKRLAEVREKAKKAIEKADAALKPRGKE